MWGVGIKEFKENLDVYLNDFLRDDEVLAIDTENRKFVIMTMEHYMKLKVEMLAKGFRMGEANVTMLDNEDL